MQNNMLIFINLFCAFHAKLRIIKQFKHQTYVDKCTTFPPNIPNKQNNQIEVTTNETETIKMLKE